MPLHHFSHNADHGVVVCRLCSTCLIARKESWIIHLRASPHRSTGEELRLIVDHLSTYTGLRSFDELRQRAIDLRCQAQPCRSIDGLEIYDGYTCICADGECHFQTRRLRTMREHMHVHAKKAKQHSEATPLWRACKLQTYFTAKGMIDYFEVEDAAPTISQQAAPLDISPSSSSSSTSISATAVQHARSQFHQVIKDQICHRSRLSDVGRDALRFDSRSDFEPWLVTTGFPTHLDGLRDAEIRSSYLLPASLDGNALLDGSSEASSDSHLRRILIAAEHTLRDAHRLCSDRSPDRKLTQQRALTLNYFRLNDASDAATSREAYLRCPKNKNLLVTYF